MSSVRDQVDIGKGVGCCCSSTLPTVGKGSFTMNGEIPTIPIISLAGIASLSDCKFYLLNDFFVCSESLQLPIY